MPTQLPKALFLIRWSVVLFLLPWVIGKFTKPETTQAIFAKYYMIESLPLPVAYAIGVAWALALAAFAFGFKRTISYGAVMLFHGVGTLFTWKQLLPFMDQFNALFLAAIPTLGAMVALFLLREQDTIGTIGK
jgi:hypothetical protein